MAPKGQETHKAFPYGNRVLGLELDLLLTSNHYTVGFGLCKLFAFVTLQPEIVQSLKHLASGFDSRQQNSFFFPPVLSPDPL
jgi:hypothetical protein